LSRIIRGSMLAHGSRVFEVALISLDVFASNDDVVSKTFKRRGALYDVQKFLLLSSNIGFYSIGMTKCGAR
jgi:hypothetical protein